MKRILFIFLFAAWVNGSYAQQDAQFTQYMLNKTLFNPASAGVSGAICLTGFGRDQWIGIMEEDGTSVNPLSCGLAFEMPLYAVKSGVGLIFLYDRLGYEKNVNVKLNYAYHHTFHKKHVLSFGLSFGIISKSIDYSKLTPIDDPMIQSNSIERGTITDVGLGIHYQAFDKFYAGLSVTNLIGSSAEIGGPEFNMVRHYYLFSAYDFVIKNNGKQKLVVTPGFLLKAVTGAVQLDLNAIVTCNDLYWGGLVYRLEDALGILAGINYNGFRLGVSYDITMNPVFSKDNRHSVELVLKYCYFIHPKIVKKSGYNIRNL